MGFSAALLNYPWYSVVRVRHAKRPRLGHRLQVGFLHGEPAGFRVCLVDGAAKSREFPFVAPRAPQRQLHHLVSHRHAPRQRPVLQHQCRQVALVLERRENLRVGAETSTTPAALHHGARRRRQFEILEENPRDIRRRRQTRGLGAGNCPYQRVSLALNLAQPPVRLPDLPAQDARVERHPGRLHLGQRGDQSHLRVPQRGAQFRVLNVWVFHPGRPEPRNDRGDVRGEARGGGHGGGRGRRVRSARARPAEGPPRGCANRRGIHAVRVVKSQNRLRQALLDG